MSETATLGALRTGVFVPRDGAELYERSWIVTAPKACVVIVHGFGEHCARYGHVAERFNEEGFSVYSYDQRGHGESPGKMGTVDSVDRLCEDLEDFLQRVQGNVGQSPIFVFGHSMGGLVLAVLAIKEPENIRGLLFSSASLKGDNVSSLLRTAAALLARFLPDVAVRELDTSGLSRIPEVVQRYRSDPLVYHGKIGALSGRTLMLAMDVVGESLHEITLPFIAQHGTMDRVVPPAASKMLFERAGTKDKILKLYEGGLP